MGHGAIAPEDPELGPGARAPEDPEYRSSTSANERFQAHENKKNQGNNPQELAHKRRRAHPQKRFAMAPESLLQAILKGLPLYKESLETGVRIVFQIHRNQHKVLRIVYDGPNKGRNQSPETSTKETEV